LRRRPSQIAKARQFNGPDRYLPIPRRPLHDGWRVPIDFHCQERYLSATKIGYARDDVDHRTSYSKQLAAAAAAFINPHEYSFIFIFHRLPFPTYSLCFAFRA
jgi:hypothetical protein